MKIFIRFLVFCASVFAVQNALTDSPRRIPNNDDWWGSEAAKGNNDTRIRPFKIQFENSMIKDLKYRLRNHRPFSPPLEGAGFTYGFNTNSLDEWVSYWGKSYNFRARERYLNQFPHFKTNIQGLDMHFIWIKPKVECGVEVLPLLMLHGWSGSIVEFYKAIPLLNKGSKKRGFAFEFIIPSLPGFGFSSGPVRPGLGGTEMAVVMRNLMHRLGYKQFYLQGGDWGSYIGSNIASFYPDEVLGFHTNFGISNSLSMVATFFQGSINPALQALVVEPAVADRLYPLSAVLTGLAQETGYFHIQATKPDTVGVAMSDSPSGLLAYMFQLMSSITRREYVSSEDGGLTKHYTKDELLDNLMIYWMNNAFTTSARIYAETYNTRNLNNGYLEHSSSVPTWVLQAKSEIIYMSKQLLRFTFKNIINTTVIETGGHYLAFELPEIFSKDVITAIIEFRRIHKEGCKDEL